MNVEEAKDIAVGTRVMWGGNKRDLGRVTARGTDAFRVEWDNGEGGWFAHDRAAQVARLPPFKARRPKKPATPAPTEPTP